MSIIFQAVHVLPSHLATETPITSKIPFSLESASSSVMESTVPKPYMLMEDWLAGGKGREESIALTPDVINTKVPQRSQPPTGRRETEVEKSKHIQVAPLLATTPNADQMKGVTHGHDLVATVSSKGIVPGSITTPTTPSLSEFTTSILTHFNREKAGCGTSQLQEPLGGASELQVTHVATPEEPVLLSQQNPLLCTNEEKGTPEEPVLHYKNLPQVMVQQESPEEPILTHPENLPYRIRGPANDADIPKEPVLFYQQMTPKTLSMSSALRKTKDPIPSKFLMPCMDESNEMPKTPELSDMTRSILSLVSHQAPPEPQRDHHRPSQHHRDHHETYSHKDHHGFTHHHKENHESYNLPRDHQGPTQYHRDHYEPLHPHRDHRGLTQPHTEHKHHTRPASHTHHKLGQSFSAAMNQLNSAEDDENTWGVWEARQQWPSVSASRQEKAVWDKFQAGVDHYQRNGIPPSPQLSDITQKILGQLRK